MRRAQDPRSLRRVAAGNRRTIRLPEDGEQVNLDDGERTIIHSVAYALAEDEAGAASGFLAVQPKFKSGMVVTLRCPTRTRQLAEAFFATKALDRMY